MQSLLFIHLTVDDGSHEAVASRAGCHIGGLQPISPRRPFTAQVKEWRLYATAGSPIGHHQGQFLLSLSLFLFIYLFIVKSIAKGHLINAWEVWR